MGFFNSLLGMLSGDKCPACGTPGVRKSGSEIRCFNPLCKYFNPSLGPSGAPPQHPQPPQQPTVQAQQPSQGRPSGWSSSPASAGSVAIKYRNFQGQSKTFNAKASSLYREKNHISAEVPPQGQRISLSRDRIQNLKEIEDQMPQRVEPGQDWPNKKERQVLNYHKKHNSTSPLFEKIRAKYPKW